jgi:hypothetical protein
MSTDARGTGPTSMLLDGFMPEFDTTRIEQRVIDALPAAVYKAAIRAELADVMSRSRIVRLAELRNAGDWIRLAERPPNEFAFGAIGRFWGGETVWEEIESAAFPSFDKPGYARIAANLSLRPGGDGRTLLSYEVRTHASDEVARAAFLRYWTSASAGAGFVMRAALDLIADEVQAAG